MRTSHNSLYKTYPAHNLFKWVDQGEMVSIAGIMRRTRTIGIVGLVYTPPERRGRGYARSLTLKVSEVIQQRGMPYCGLFTDKSNPVSNRIYAQVGYNPLCEFEDLVFGDLA